MIFRAFFWFGFVWLMTQHEQDIGLETPPLILALDKLAGREETTQPMPEPADMNVTAQPRQGNPASQ